VLTNWRPSDEPAASVRSNREPAIFALGVAGAVMLALAVESFRLTNSGLTFDEAATFTYARLEFSDLYAALQSSDVFFGAYYAWMHVWMRLGENEAALRSFSILCGACAVIAIAFLARRLCDTKAGIAAGLLAATSPLLFDVARQARPYALLVLVAALSSFAFWGAAERPTLRRWVLYVLISAIGCYVHLFVLCLVGAHALWALTSRRILYRRGLPWAVLAIALSTTPLLVILHHYPTVNGYIPRPTLRALADTWEWFAGSRELAALAIVLLAIIMVTQLRQRKRIVLTPVAMFLIITVIIPPLLVFGESFVAKPTYLQRYLVEAWPSYVVAVGIILTRLRPIYFVPVGIVMLALQTRVSLTSHLKVSQQWREASTMIFAGALPGDQLVVYPPFGMLPYDYYRLRLQPRNSLLLRSPKSSPFPLTMTTNDDNKFAIDASLLGASAQPGRIWFLVGWTDDARTAPGLRILTRALPPSYRLAFDRRLVHEDVLRYDSHSGNGLK
jgi:mannosyltransferase